VLFYEGDTTSVFSILLDGRVEIIKSFGTELERLIKVLIRGDFFGEMSLVERDRTRTATARVKTPAQMLEIPVQDFDWLVRRNSRLAFLLMRVMIDRVVENETATIADLLEKNRLLGESLRELQEAQVHLITRERTETELATANEIQKRMLPEKIPVIPGWSIDALWQPARAVSGDFYDFIPLPDGRLALVIGDVTDKGVPAALLMAVTRSTVRTAASQAPTPGDLLAQVNDILCQQIPLNRFATCQVGFLDPASGHLELANAGHPLPLIAHQGSVREIRATGLALGIFPGMVYEVIQDRLEPGDSLLCYSDALSEGRNPQGQLLDTAGVKQMFLQGLQQPGRLITSLLEQLNQYTGTASGLEDDITLVAVSRHGEPGML
jgi:serine phosphatase RsbU (regulator of sigma subunit)